MKFKGVSPIILHIAIQIVTKLTQNVTAFLPQGPEESGNTEPKKEGESCGEDIFQSCGDCAEGLECPPDNGFFPQCMTCQTIAVGPVDCEWSEWNMYGQCSVTCGEGTFKKYRYKSVEEKNGGTCSGEEDTIDTCMTPCPVDCIWGEWVSSECSQSCDGGTLTRSREKLVEDNHGGICPDNVSSETEDCNEIPCWYFEPPEPVDCEWSPWRMVDSDGKDLIIDGIDHKCSKTCGGGEKLMERWHIELAEHGGKNCSGESNMVQKCNIQDCPTTTITTTTTTTTPTTTTRYRFRWGQGNTVKEEKNSDSKNFQPFNPFALLSAFLFL